LSTENTEITENIVMNSHNPDGLVLPVTDTHGELKPISHYAQELKKSLPRTIFEPYTARILWLCGYALIGVTALTVISQIPMPWPFKLFLAILAGNCFGGMAFFAHELLHGSVIRNRMAQDVLGFIAFITFFISPTFWRVWHNQLHHGHTQAIITDPDAFPPLRIYKHSRFMQFMFPFTPGSGHLRSYSYFFFWFSFHILTAQTYLRFRNSVYKNLNHTRVTLEMIGQISIWGLFLYWLGPHLLFWTFVIPFMTQNYFAMSYIATNHNLSPLTKVNDPLINSLSVTNHPILEWFHLNFGYHVEHHIFPAVNGIHAKKLHALLKENFPGRYQVMNKLKAIKGLYNTSRIYANANTLINPETKQTYSTIQPQ